MAATIHCDKCNKKKSPTADGWGNGWLSGRPDGYDSVNNHFDLCPNCNKKIFDLLKKFFNN